MKPGIKLLPLIFAALAFSASAHDDKPAGPVTIFNTPVGDTVLVLCEKDVAPLGDKEGRISLISAQDLRTGPRHVKWLRSLEVRKIVD